MKISGTGLCVSFLNIRPGFDKPARALILHRSGLPGSSAVKWMLGPFDLLSVTPLERHSDGRLGNHLPFSGGQMVGSASFAAFELDEPDLAPIATTLNQPVNLVSMLKINPSVVEAVGIAAESVFIQSLGRLLKTRKMRSATAGLSTVSVLGSLGWYELVLVLGSSDLGAMPFVVTNLRTLTVKEILGADPNIPVELLGAPFLETSFSVVGFDPDWALRENELSLPGSAGVASVSARTVLVCKPGAAGLVSKKIKEAFGKRADQRNPLGKGEFSIATKMPFPLLASSLFRFRDEVGDLLQETETSVELRLKSTRTWKSDVGMPSGVRENVDVIHATRFADIEREDPYAFAKIQQVFITFNGRMTDPLIADSFGDMVPFVRRLANSGAGDDNSSPPAALSEACDLFLLGMSQRFPGSYLSLLSPTRLANVQEEYAVSRVLLAADSIVKEVVERSGEKWTGFSMFGLYNEFRRQLHGVVNLPWTTLLHPELWWQLPHEAGHDFFEKLDLLNDQELRTQLKKYVGIEPHWLDDPDWTSTVDPHVEWLWELTADLVDYTFFFERRWEDYLSTTWSHLLAHLDSVDKTRTIAEQLDRAFLLWTTRVDGEELRTGLTDFDFFLKRWAGLLDQIADAVGAPNPEWLTRISEEVAPASYNRVVRWRVIEQWLDQRIQSLESDPKPPIETLGALEAILAGEPVPRIDSPLHLLKDLTFRGRRRPKLTFPQRVAALLSLSSTYKLTSPGVSPSRVQFHD